MDGKLARQYFYDTWRRTYIEIVASGGRMFVRSLTTRLDLGSVVSFPSRGSGSLFCASWNDWRPSDG